MADGKTPEGYGAWDLPKDGKPGAWMIAKPGPMEECHDTAVHILRADQLRNWIAPHALLWEVKPQGKVVNVGNKCICKKARILRQVPGWTRETGWEALCKIVERSFENLPAGETKPQAAIATLRKWLKGGATGEDLRRAAAAAYAVYADYVPYTYAYAAYAAVYAAYAAADAARYAAAATYNATDAARYAAATAADAARYAAAYADEKEEQTRIICRAAGITGGGR